jgi:hypothetical protein
VYRGIVQWWLCSELESGRSSCTYQEIGKLLDASPGAHKRGHWMW